MREPARAPALIAVALCALLLAGCGASGPKALPDPEPELRQLTDTGYAPRRRLATMSVRESWSGSDPRIDVTLIAPSSAGDAPYPLIVYLPGLGESAASGLLWRKAWAEAGYTVLAFQPAALTEEIWGTRQAREGDFQALARQHYTEAASLARLNTLDAVLAEFRRRAAAGTVPYEYTDTTRVALAGFELGAHTASVAAGERVSGAAGERVSGAAARISGLRALITLSPYYNRTTENAESRYSALTLPVLAITGSDDDDPFHLVRDPEQRKIPWASMPAGGKLLLAITGGTHTMLSGDGYYDTSVAKGPSDAEEAARKREQERQQQPTTGQRRRRFIEAGLDALHAAAPDRAGHSRERESRNQNSARRPGPLNSAPIPISLRHIAAVASVSTAFLDTHLRSDPQARKWLDDDAQRWLGGASQLRAR